MLITIPTSGSALWSGLFSDRRTRHYPTVSVAIGCNRIEVSSTLLVADHTSRTSLSISNTIMPGSNWLSTMFSASSQVESADSHLNANIQSRLHSITEPTNIATRNNNIIPRIREHEDHESFKPHITKPDSQAQTTLAQPERMRKTSLAPTPWRKHPITQPNDLPKVTSAQTITLVLQNGTIWHTHSDRWLAAARAGTVQPIYLLVVAGGLPLPLPRKMQAYSGSSREASRVARNSVFFAHRGCDSQ